LCKSSATFLIFFVHTHLGESIPPIKRYQFGPTDGNCERRHAKSQSKYLLRHTILPSERKDIRKTETLISHAEGKQNVEKRKANIKMFRMTRRHQRGCSRACSFLQYKTFSMGEQMIAASDIARFYSGHRRYLLSKIHAKKRDQKLNPQL